jgi:dynein light chain LC8-type
MFDFLLNKLCKEIREKLESKFGKYWHVFVGKNFGAYNVHDRYQYLFFKYKSYSFLIYKTTC